VLPTGSAQARRVRYASAADFARARFRSSGFLGLLEARQIHPQNVHGKENAWRRGVLTSVIAMTFQNGTRIGTLRANAKDCLASWRVFDVSVSCLRVPRP
jgi:hypothetical protein